MQSGKDKTQWYWGGGLLAKIKQKSVEYKGGKADEQEKERVRLEARQGHKVTESWAGSEGQAGGLQHVYIRVWAVWGYAGAGQWGCGRVPVQMLCDRVSQLRPGS